MAEELLVVLNRNENTGFGFSLLGKPGLPPIIYNILDDSPAAESGEVEVGDVILKVNETDVNRFTTKEVLKCLRLSSDPVTLKIKRDPKIKATVRKHLLSTTGNSDSGENCGSRTTIEQPLINSSGSNNKNNRPEPGVHHYQHYQQQQQHARTNGSCPEEEPLLSKYNESNERLQWEPLSSSNEHNKTNRHQPKFEAYMMTGEHILNISRIPQSTSILPKQQKKIDSLRYHNSHTHHLRHQPYQHSSVPNSPNEMDMGLKGNRSGTNSANTSPISANKWGNDHHYPHHHHHHHQQQQQQQQQQVNSTNNYVRTSRSEDQLQGGGQNDLNSDINTVNIDVDEDITSSLNTLLDTRPDSGNSGGGGCGGNNASNSSDSDRIVWTYNAPITEQQQHKQFTHTLSNGSSSSHNSNTSPTSSSTSPLYSGGSPASPTSVSSSVMSSQSSSKRLQPIINNNNCLQQPHHHQQQQQQHIGATNGDFSVSEAISNISSPDYHDDDSMGIRDCVMEISDHSDSDSTLLVSEPKQRHKGNHNNHNNNSNSDVGGGDHRIVIQVKGPDKDNLMRDRGKYCDNRYGYQSSNDTTLEQMYDDEETTTITREKSSSSPQSSEDESDVESLHSFHYSPKAVDLPSAIRLAKRLYSLDGFKKSDVSRHLSKNNDFSRAVAEEYLKYFEFENDTLDIALRKFLKQFSLTGETQERERVLVHFSKRYLDCNPGTFNSQDAVHTLTCAIMLLNTDLHGQNVNRKMTCNEFIENLAGLNECENFPRDVLKQLYHAIKNYPLEWALDEENEENNAQMQMKNTDQLNIGNPFLDVPISTNAIEYKKGYVMRKCCYEANAKRTPFHKRSWKMFYCTLRDLVLYLHKDENGFRKNQISDNVHNAIRIHHALATKANDYTKKQYVFRLQTADQAEYLFQTSDSKELQSWIDTINFVCASFSAPPLEAAVGSQKKFQRPLLPCSHTKLNLREQLRDHEERVMRLEAELEEHRKSPPEKGSKSLIIQNYKEKEAYLNYEVKRYRTYAYMLRSRMSQYPELGISLVENSIGEVDEAASSSCNLQIESGLSSSLLLDNNSSGNNSQIGGNLIPPPIPDRPSPSTNRRSPE